MRVNHAESAYHYQLLIKNLLQTPIVKNLDQEIVYKDKVRLRYRDFHERVGRLAAMLQAMGIKPGDTVAMMDWDSHRYLEAFFAVPMIGAVLHTINVRLSPEQLIYTIDHAEDDMMIIHADFLPLVEHIRGRIDTVKKYVMIAEGPAVQAPSFDIEGEYEALLAAHAPLESFPDFDENARATTFYTTGTTGMPKGVYFSHRQLVIHTLSVCATLASPGQQGRVGREDVYMPITPMFHVHAWGMPYMMTFLGTKQVYPGKYVPDQLLALIRNEGVTFSHCVPTILHMMLNHPAAAGMDFSKWKVIVGGAVLPKNLCAAALERGIDIFAGYGMSEACPVISLAHLEPAELDLPVEQQVLRRVRTGKPVAMVQVKVTDEQHLPVPQDDRSAGEIVVRAPWLTMGYLKDHANSKKLWQEGWLHTNDVACVDRYGSVRVTDRKKDLIKIGGEWVSSLELEDIIAALPDIQEVAVIIHIDARWGETPLALVVKKDGAQLEKKAIISQIRQYVEKGLLPREAITTRVKFVDSLPKTSVGKVSKLTLRKEYGGEE